MKFYGHANLQQNELQNAVLSTLTSFPPSPAVGQMAFVNSTVYICISVANSLPVWVPLTREITAYTHTQDVAASSWVVTHNLNTTSVNVQVWDGSNSAVIPNDVQTTSPNTLNISVSSPIVGRAVIVTGHFDGNVKPTYAFTFYQSTAATTWTVVHNLGYNPIVRVFIGNQEVQPLTTTFPDTNTVVLTFTNPEAGYVRLI